MSTLHNFEKAKILKERHVNISIEWGGTEHFTDISNMSLEGVVRFLEIMQMDTEKDINSYLDVLIQTEYDNQ